MGCKPLSSLFSDLFPLVGLMQMLSSSYALQIQMSWNIEGIITICACNENPEVTYLTLLHSWFLRRSAR